MFRGENNILNSFGRAVGDLLSSLIRSIRDLLTNEDFYGFLFLGAFAGFIFWAVSHLIIPNGAWDTVFEKQMNEVPNIEYMHVANITLTETDGEGDMSMADSINVGSVQRFAKLHNILHDAAVSKLTAPHMYRFEMLPGLNHNAALDTHYITTFDQEQIWMAYLSGLILGTTSSSEVQQNIAAKQKKLKVVTYFIPSNALREATDDWYYLAMWNKRRFHTCVLPEAVDHTNTKQVAMLQIRHMCKMHKTFNYFVADNQE